MKNSLRSFLRNGNANHGHCSLVRLVAVHDARKCARRLIYVDVHKMAFHSSTQRGFWLFPEPGRLQRLRDDANADGRERIGKAKPELPTDTFLTPEEEVRLSDRSDPSFEDQRNNSDIFLWQMAWLNYYAEKMKAYHSALHLPSKGLVCKLTKNASAPARF